jgi:hypothetical protein
MTVGLTKPTEKSADLAGADRYRNITNRGHRLRAKRENNLAELIALLTIKMIQDYQAEIRPDNLEEMYDSTGDAGFLKLEYIIKMAKEITRSDIDYVEIESAYSGNANLQGCWDKHGILRGLRTNRRLISEVFPNYPCLNS